MTARSHGADGARLDRLHSSMILRAERDADHDAIAEVVSAAFGDLSIAVLVERLRGSDCYRAEFALVAEVDDAIVGYVMLTTASLERPESVPVLLLSPLAVAPTRQGRGIGSALVRAVVERADERGEPLVVVEGIPAYYPRLGFEPARAFGIEPPSPTIHDEAFMIRRLSGYHPALTGRVRYPPAFDEWHESDEDS